MANNFQAFNWKSFVVFNSTVSASERTKLTLFFDRLSRHAIGKRFLIQASKAGSLTIDGSNTDRSRYYNQYRTIELSHLSFTGNDSSYITTMLHEITHHIYRSHYIFAVQDPVEQLVDVIRDDSLKAGLTNLQYKNILQPFTDIGISALFGHEYTVAQEMHLISMACRHIREFGDQERRRP
jgi:hypothetical protein